MLNQPLLIDTSGMQRIAHASSDDGQAIRWTELSLFYSPAGIRPSHPGRKFLAESVGASRFPGEREFKRQRVGKSIEEACRVFDNSRLHDQIIEQAQAWEDAHPQAERRKAPTIQFNGAGGLRGALLWLYPQQSPEASDIKLAQLLETDWGVPARTVTHTLRTERLTGGEVPTWCKAFLGALQHFDRDAFHGMRRPSDGN
jgi:hypothetical protein